MKEVSPSKFINEVLVSKGLDHQFLRAHLTVRKFADLLSERPDRCVLESTGLKAI
jgi:hypothetical protein